MFNIEQLIQAAEYLDRRERGEKIAKSEDFTRAFICGVFLPRSFGILSYRIVSMLNSFKFQKLNMDMQQHFQCQMS